MEVKDCKDCDKCSTILDDNILWHICDYYELQIERIKTCRFKEK